MRRPDNSLPLLHEFIGGKSGSGKSTVIKKRIGNRRHVFVWDFKNEYHDMPGFTSTDDPVEFVRLVKRGGRVAFVAPPGRFEFFCRVVWAHADCICIVEELASVTGSGKARDTWLQLSTQGRGMGIHIIATGIRAAEVDKTLLSCLRILHVRQHDLPSDQRGAAEKLGVPFEQVAALGKYDWIERNMDTGAITSNVKPPAVKLPRAAGQPRRKRR